MPGDLPELGIMLPATPLQHLIARAFDDLLVMTSGNVHDDPIVIEEHEAFEQLAGIADAFLVNNRAIIERFDDSVVRVLEPGWGRPSGPSHSPRPWSCAGTDQAACSSARTW